MQNPISSKLVGTGAVVPLGVGGGRWVQITTPDTNSASVLIGGAEVTSTVGYPIPVGWAGQFLPPTVDLYSFYDLESINIYIALNDVVYVLKGG